MITYWVIFSLPQTKSIMASRINIFLYLQTYFFLFSERTQHVLIKTFCADFTKDLFSVKKRHSETVYVTVYFYDSSNNLTVTGFVNDSIGLKNIEMKVYIMSRQFIKISTKKCICLSV